MGLFGAIVKTVVNVATLPVDMAKDVVQLMDPDRPVGKATSDKLQQIKDNVDEDALDV